MEKNGTKTVIQRNPYHGWIPVILQNDNEDITTHLASDSLANLLNVYENSENKIFEGFSLAKTASLASFKAFSAILQSFRQSGDFIFCCFVDDSMV